jgi:general secretion pathway protein E
VNPKIELTFASGLRSILRQDPDVIMVGEIRDLETAEIAIQAALTGHLVFSTLHTNDSFGAMTRLLDMGIEPFLASSSVTAVMAQRLVRRVCPDCREAYQPTREELEELGASPQRLMGQTLLVVDDEIRTLVMKNADAAALRRAATARGMNTLRGDGADKILQGATTLEEVLRVTQEDLV